MQIAQDLVKELFDYRDGKLFWKVARIRIKVGDETGTINSTGYKCTTVNQKTYLTHRLIFLYHHGYLPKMIDHIDGNPLNNNIENLREANPYQNQQNAKRRSDSTTGIKGVTVCKHANKYMARVRINGVRKYLGLFDTLAEAEKVITQTRLQLHKEFTKHE
jgi:hypothetical protein